MTNDLSDPKYAPIIRQHIIDAVTNYRPGKGMNAVPGMPVSHFPLENGPIIRGLLAEGTLRLVEVTKPSKVDPSKTMTYAYLTVA